MIVAVFNIKKYYISLFVVLMLLLIYSCTSNPNSKTSGKSVYNEILPDTINFTFHVKPILSDRCFKCHGPDKNAIEGGLLLHTAEGAFAALGEQKDHFAIVPNDIEKSELVHRIYAADSTILMPPPESNLQLTNYEKGVLKKWIAQGAEYQQHWAFIPPKKPRLPNLDYTHWGTNEIDNFIYDKLKTKQLQPNKKADKAKLLRRVYFSLTGLPPSPEALASFINNPSEKAYEEIIDSLLTTTDYAEHMASEWMDIARYADTHGYQDDFERTMWPWRDWVIYAFKENKPYNQFVTEQLAGDLLPNATLEQQLATGFNRNHKITAEGGVIPEEYRIEYVEDRAQTFGTAFLGLTFECARCHDHKYDPISQQNHFELFSFFNNIPEKGLLANAQEIPEPYMLVTQKKVDKLLSFINFKKSKQTEVPVMVMKEMSTPRDAFILDRGVYDQPTIQVFPNTPTAILAFPESLPKNRLGLSKWLFKEENPLTARVVVNRYWQRMFGQGLVSTTFDFGNQGALPTHPELLDFLAIKFQEVGWDTKKILKYMAMSASFQQDTNISEQQLELDPENKWLSRASRIRLSAEMIRDQALKISGLLNPEIGGPSVKPYQPDGIWEETTGGGGGSTASYIQSSGKDLYRKSLYTFWKRTVPPPSMMMFDAASRDLCSVIRQDTNTPLQALVLLNDPQIIEAAKLLALKAHNLNGSSLAKQMEYIFESATSRKPDANEALLLQEYYDEMILKIKADNLVAKEYLSIGAYDLAEDFKTNEVAALALVAHTILNLDETINRG
jgi:hypothetical protein